MAELLQRGISKDIANEVLDEYFSQNDEEYICKKAYENFINTENVMKNYLRLW